MNVELIWDVDCPNVDDARANLRQAMSNVEPDAELREWRRDDENAPDYVRDYGSPTVLVEGEDVAGPGTEADANCCRIYSTDDGRMAGVPSVDMIADALRRARD